MQERGKIYIKVRQQVVACDWLRAYVAITAQFSYIILLFVHFISFIHSFISFIHSFQTFIPSIHPFFRRSG